MAAHSAAFIKKIKAQLDEEKNRLERELGQLTDKEGRDFPQYGDDMDENAFEVQDFTSAITIEATLESELKDVKKALKQIEDGTYGVCGYCNSPIEEKRLEARPTSTSCVACKKALKQEI